MSTWERSAGFPLPLVVHIVGAATYAIGLAAGTQVFPDSIAAPCSAPACSPPISPRAPAG